MIPPINHVEGWRYIRQRKQAQINKDTISENTTRIDDNYRVVDKVTTQNKSAYKYEAPFKSRMKIIKRGQKNRHLTNGRGYNEDTYPQY